MLAVLTAEQLLALGELTVRYAQLDSALALVGRNLLGCDDEEIACGLTDDLDISRKIDRVRWLFNHYRRRERWWTVDLQRELCAWLERCKALVDHRNDIIHGALESDRQNRERYFIRRSRKRSAKAEEIQELNRRFVQESATVFDILYTLDRRFRGETDEPPVRLEKEPQIEIGGDEV